MGIYVFPVPQQFFPNLFSALKAFFPEIASHGLWMALRDFFATAFPNFNDFFWFYDGTWGVWWSMALTLLKAAYYSIISIVISTITGFIFSRMRFVGKKIVFYYFMSSMMIPGVAVAVPSLLLIVRFPLVGGNNILGQGGSGFYNNMATHFVFGLFNIFSTFLIIQSMKGIGGELAEAAEIDGAGKFKTIFSIYLPLLIPILAYMTICTVIGTWNDYSTCLFYLPNYPKAWTIGYYVTQLTNMFGVSSPGGNVNYPAIFGVFTVFNILPLLVFLLSQRFFMSGLAMGAIKG